MYYVGIDIGKTDHCMGAIDGHGTCISKPWMFKQTLEHFDQLNERLCQLGTREDIKIGVKATGHYWKVLWTFLIDHDWTVEVFNPVLSAGYARANLRGRRTDADSTLVIAKVIRDGGFTPFIANDSMDQLKTLCRQRRYMVCQQSDAKRRLSTLIDQIFPEFGTLFSDLYGKTALAVLSAFPSARRVAKVHLKRLTTLILKASGHRLNAQRAREVRQAAQSSTALTRHDEATERAIQIMIQHIQFSQEQIQQLEKHIAEQFDAIDHSIKSIPGLGDVVAPVILSELGDLNRFKGAKAAHKMLAYAGADPRIRQSGQWKGQVKMSKRGSPTLRTALYQAAHNVRLHCPEFQKIYNQHKVEKHKHHGVAMSHVVRKLLQVIQAMAQTGLPFDASKIGANNV